MSPAALRTFVTGGLIVVVALRGLISARGGGVGLYVFLLVTGVVVMLISGAMLFESGDGAAADPSPRGHKADLSDGERDEL